MRLQFFVGQEGRAEDQEERPAHPEAAAAEVKHKEGAEQSAEKELKRVDEPEVSLGWVFGINAVIFRAVDDKDADGYGGKVRDDPEIIPKRIDAFERYGVKGESTEERGRGNGPLEARVGGSQVDTERLAEKTVGHGPSENSMGPEEACSLGCVSVL